MSKLRLDHLLVQQGLAPSRTKAQALIAGGCVYVDGELHSKANKAIALDAEIMLHGQEHPWVSRGGMKLDTALQHFDLNVDGAVAIDVGASAGGFTDVLLHYGASKVYAVDVGHGQLAAKLEADERVISMEHCNARYLTEEDIAEPIDVIVCDASFISLTKVLSAPMALANPKATLVALIKPQFEVGKANLSKGGVVRDAALHAKACDDVQAWFAQSHPQWQCLGVIGSPITGPEGNEEFLVAYSLAS